MLERSEAMSSLRSTTPATTTSSSHPVPPSKSLAVVTSNGQPSSSGVPPSTSPAHTNGVSGAVSHTNGTVEPRFAATSPPTNGVAVSVSVSATNATSNGGVAPPRAPSRSHPATLTSHQHHHHPSSSSESRICEVWADNVDQEIDKISTLVEKYPYVSVDTEFPGVVARPLGPFRDSNDYHFRTLKCNVDLLNIIQLGLTFQNGDGEYPPGTCTWQFNFAFNLDDDMYAQDSIELLERAGLDFKKLRRQGIKVERFGEAIMMSGVVLNDEVHWISFHGGYDFAYLTKVLSAKQLPNEERDFFELVRAFFPHIYDLKCLMRGLRDPPSTATLASSLTSTPTPLSIPQRGDRDREQNRERGRLEASGLQGLADHFGVKRVGSPHQAGSDSHLTGGVFFRLRDLEPRLDAKQYHGQLYGLGGSSSRNGFS